MLRPPDCTASTWYSLHEEADLPKRTLPADFRRAGESVDNRTLTNPLRPNEPVTCASMRSSGSDNRASPCVDLTIPLQEQPLAKLRLAPGPRRAPPGFPPRRFAALHLALQERPGRLPPPSSSWQLSGALSGPRRAGVSRPGASAIFRSRRRSPAHPRPSSSCPTSARALSAGEGSGECPWAARPASARGRADLP